MKMNNTNKPERMSLDEKNLQSETGETFRRGASRQKEIKHFTAGQGESGYGDAWTAAVQEYLKTRYGKENGPEGCEIAAGGTTYRVLEREQKGITVFYDDTGDTLFDVENERLESEYRQLIERKEAAGTSASPNKVTDGKKAGRKAKKEDGPIKTYTSGAEKLQDEKMKMMESVRPEHKAVMQTQMDAMFRALIEKAQTDPGFETKVLLPHKNMGRCMKFCAERARGLREPSEQEKEAARKYRIPIMTPVSSDMVLGWILEYYDSDDKAEAEKEEKQRAGRKQSGAEAGKKDDAGPQNPAEKKGPEHKKPEHKKPEHKKPSEAGKKKEKKLGMENQISLFDFMGE